MIPDCGDSGAGVTSAVAVPLVEQLSREDRGDGLWSFLQGPETVAVTRRGTAGERLFVIEPHFDDAILSAGGRLLRVLAPVTVATVFSDSSVVHPQVAPALARAELSARQLRRAESAAALRALAASGLELGRRDGEVEAAAPEELPAIARVIEEQLFDAIPADALVLFPAGFGRNPAHLAVSAAATRFPFHALYEDIAPIGAYGRLTEEFWWTYDRLVRAGYQPSTIDIDDVLEQRVDLASIYRSQFSYRQARTLIDYARGVAISMPHLGESVPGFTFGERIYIPAAARERWRSGGWI
ncbi:MAG: PIG-L deacetylase family protein [Thermoanaerobaculia bacterium]